MPARIVFVTGKGGTGKSRIVRALATEAATHGHPALVIAMPPSAPALVIAMPPSAPAPPAGVPPPVRRGYEEKTLDERHDLEAFLTRLLGFGFLARRLQRSGTFSAVAAAAPGLRDLVALSAIAHEARRRRGLVIVDAPASGHSTPMLAAPRRVLELAPLGPAAREARRAVLLLADPRAFVALLVATPEELAITETLALRGDVARSGVGASRVVLNGCWPAYMSQRDGERGAAASASPAAALHWQRHSRQRELADALEAQIGSCCRIGFVFDGESAVLPRDDVAALLAALERITA